MMNRSLATATITAILMAGCVTPAVNPARQVNIWATFDANQAKAMMMPGPNTITGSALIRQRGGGVVTCAGGPVFLIPSTAYARERLTDLYGGKSYAPVVPVSIANDPPEYKTHIRQSVCNAQGFFRFDGVADGEFFVQTNVMWRAGNSTEGGALVKSVLVKGGQTQEITLAP